MKIYTRTGDYGMTRINRGERIPKTSQRIETNGAIDELNCLIGIVRSLSDNGDLNDELREVQRQLMVIMSIIATPLSRRSDNPRILPADIVADLEKRIDAITVEAGETRTFKLPGGTPTAAFLHMARSVCRRAEREIWRLDEAEGVENLIKMYINRLSDFLFIMACKINGNENPDGGEDWERFGETYRLKV